jgi:ribosomal protein L7Ae-like RNA K-turn-binding protein
VVEKKLYGAIGLARRAGKCITGDFVVERALKAKKTMYIIIDDTASGATKARYRALCERMDVPYMELAGLGLAIGKPGNKVAAVTDGNFAGMIGGLLEKTEGT